MDPKVYVAAKRGDLDALKQALDESGNSPLHQVNSKNDTILHISASSGHHQLVEMILNYWPNLIKKKNLAGNLAIHVAASAGKIDVVKYLVHFAESGSSGIEIQDSERWVESQLMEVNEKVNTPLHEAVKNEQTEVAFFLVESCPSAAHCFNQKRKSPLYIAVTSKCVELVEIMTKNPDQLVIYRHGVKLKSKSIAHVAITNRNIDALDIVLQKDSELIHCREKGWTPLSYAVYTGYVEGVSYLLEKYTVCAYGMNENGSFPIHVAAREGLVDIIRLFHERCPDSIALINSEGQNALHIAAMRGKISAVYFILTASGLDGLLNATDYGGNTPLHLAIMCRNHPVVRSLSMDKRIDCSQMNNQGLTASGAAKRFMGISSLEVLFIFCFFISHAELD